MMQTLSVLHKKDVRASRKLKKNAFVKAKQIFFLFLCPQFSFPLLLYEPGCWLVCTWKILTYSKRKPHIVHVSWKGWCFWLYNQWKPINLMCVDTEVIAKLHLWSRRKLYSTVLNRAQPAAMPAYLSTFLSQIRLHTAEQGGFHKLKLNINTTTAFSVTDARNQAG